jgi:hypothetical protein
MSVKNTLIIEDLLTILQEVFELYRLSNKTNEEIR